MLHPSYTDLMNAVNSGVVIGEEPVVNSRYSIVIATSKRARQLIAGAEPTIPSMAGDKPLSIAVEELYQGKVKIVVPDDIDEEDDKFLMEGTGEVLDLGLEEEEIFADELETSEEEEEADAAEDVEEKEE